MRDVAGYVIYLAINLLLFVVPVVAAWLLLTDWSRPLLGCYVVGAVAFIVTESS